MPRPELHLHNQHSFTVNKDTVTLTLSKVNGGKDPNHLVTIWVFARDSSGAPRFLGFFKDGKDNKDINNSILDTIIDNGATFKPTLAGRYSAVLVSWNANEEKAKKKRPRILTSLVHTFNVNSP